MFVLLTGLLVQIAPVAWAQQGEMLLEPADWQQCWYSGHNRLAEADSLLQLEPPQAQAALELLLPIGQDDPYYATAQQMALRLALQLEHYRQTLELAEPWLRPVGPFAPEAWEAAIAAALALEEPGRALQWAQQAESIWPEDAWWSQLGFEAARRGAQLKQADGHTPPRTWRPVLESLHQAVERKPFEARLHTSLALALEQSGRRVGALLAALHATALATEAELRSQNWNRVVYLLQELLAQPAPTSKLDSLFQPTLDSAFSCVAQHLKSRQKSKPGSGPLARLPASLPPTVLYLEALLAYLPPANTPHLPESMRACLAVLRDARRLPGGVGRWAPVGVWPVEERPAGEPPLPDPEVAALWKQHAQRWLAPVKPLHPLPWAELPEVAGAPNLLQAKAQQDSVAWLPLHYGSAGKLEFAGRSQHDEWVGPVWAWHDNGQRAEQRFYDPKSRATGLWSAWNESGELVELAQWAEGERNGWSCWLYPESGAQECAYYRAGERHGPARAWHPNGQLALRSTYAKGRRVDTAWAYNLAGGLEQQTAYAPLDSLRSWGLGQGVEHGPLKRWYEQDTLQYESSLARGRIQDRLVSYYPNGKRARELPIRAGKRHGLASNYNYLGQLEQQVHYRDNAAQGYWIRFYPDGEIRRRELYAKDLREGPAEYFRPDGSRWLLERYEAGRLQQAVYFDSAGREWTPAERLETMDANNLPEGLAAEFYANGRLQATGVLDDGLKEGPWTFFYPNGAISSQQVYRSGQPTGLASAYYPDGVLQSRGELEAGTPSGLQTSFWPNGQRRMAGIVLQNKAGKASREGKRYRYYRGGGLQVRESYLEDIRHGRWREYDHRGRLRRERYYRHGVLQWIRLPRADSSGSDTVWVDTCYQVYAQRNAQGQLVYSQELYGGQPHGLELVWDPHSGDTLQLTTYQAGLAQGPTWQSFPWLRSANALYGSGTSNAGMDHGAFQDRYPNGMRRAQGSVVLDQLHGSVHQYDPGGVLWQVLPYWLGELHGPVEFYAQQDQPALVVLYTWNQPTAYLQPQTSGPPDTLPIAPDDQLLRVTYPNGQLAAEARLVNGEWQGPMRLYTTGGVLTRELTYLHGLPHGPQRTWAQSGQPLHQVETFWGVYHGEGIWYHSTGQPHYRLQFQDNQLQGPALRYSPTGRIEKRWYFESGWLVGAD